MCSQRKYLLLYLLLLDGTQIFSQTEIPFENKNWKWLFPENNKIYSLAIDADTVWAGSDVGFFKLNINTGDVINYNKINSPLPDNWILAMAIDGNHNKWIGTHKKGVVKIEGSDWRIFDPKYFKSYGMEIRDLKVENEFLWISTWGDGLIKMNMVDNSYEIFTTENSGILYDAIYNIEIDSRGTKWIATMLGVCKFEDMNWIQISNTREDFSQVINSITLDNEDNVWALYDRGAQISRYDGKEWKKFHIPDTLFRYGLCHSNMIYEDNNDNIWVGTIDGFLKFDGENWMMIDKENSGYNMSFIECARLDYKNRLWFGGWDGLFCFYEGEWERYPTGNTPIPGMDINTIAIEKIGKVWIGTSDGVATFYDGNWTIFTKENSRLQTNYIKKIVIDSTNNKWFSSYRFGLVKLDNNENDWIIYDTLNSGLPDNFISDLEIDGNNVLWIGTKRGLVSFNGISWREYKLSKSGIPLKGVNKLAFDAHNDLWLVVSNFDLKQRGDKVVKFDGESFEIINPHDNFDKLNNASVYGFYVDNNNVKWISTSENLIWYDDTTWNFMDKYKTQIFFSCLSDIFCDENFTWVCSNMGGLIRYNGSKFMVWNEENSYLPDDITTLNKDSYGNLWIGTQNQGIILYNPEGIVYEEKK